MKIPQRQSLLLQTVKILRQAIADNTWEGVLPGERQLSNQLHVSRPTLRAALDILEREKLVQSMPGKRRKILTRSTRRLRKKTATVILACAAPLHALSTNRLFLFDHLHRELQENGIRFDIFSHPAIGWDQPGAALRKLEEKPDNCYYVLALGSRATQEWFLARSQPCLVLGSTFPGVPLPSIECDYPALGRHAAGTLLGRGHRSILFLPPGDGLAGNLETEIAFKAEIDSSPHNARWIELRVSEPAADGGVTLDIQRHWERLTAQNDPPTAAFGLHPTAVVTLAMHLLRRKIRIPADFSLLCRDENPILNWTLPPVARYVMPLHNFASRLTTLVLKMVQAGALPLRHTTIMPDLVPGCSLAPPAFVAPRGPVQPRQPDRHPPTGQIT